jgi:SagB-type dehydrogenase family enzyme
LKTEGRGVGGKRGGKRPGSKEKVFFRRAGCLISYWERGSLVFENYATGRRASAAPIAAEILDFFDDWRSPESMCSHFSGYDAASLRSAAEALVAQSFLEKSPRKTNELSAIAESWKAWNPAAGFLHFSSRDLPFDLDLEETAKYMRRIARVSPMPVPVKHYPRSKQIPLPPPRSDGEFPATLLARRTWRRFSRTALALSDLSTLLGLTWGIREWMPVPPLGRFALKTAPSGGALHPIEAYVVARDVAGIARGIYHYDADRHRLELIRKGATKEQIKTYLAGQDWFSHAPAVVLMTAVFTRTQWKYKFARAYRVVLAEAGHLCQTFCLTASWLGLAPFCTMALADSKIDDTLGIDGVTEGVLYAAGVGNVPEGADWRVASLPEYVDKPKPLSRMLRTRFKELR